MTSLAKLLKNLIVEFKETPGPGQPLIASSRGPRCGGGARLLQHGLNIRESLLADRLPHSTILSRSTSKITSNRRQPHSRRPNRTPHPKGERKCGVIL